MIVSSGKCFLFVHIPKTAGSSIFQALKQYNDAPDTNENRHFDLLAICERYAHLGFHSGCKDHGRIQRLNHPLGPLGHFFKFAFVRNPWDRVVSMYGYLLQNRELTEDISFHEFVMKRHRHPFGLYREQVNFLEDQKGELAVDFIGRFENLQKDWETVENRIGMKRRLGHFKQTSHKIYKSYYNQELIDQVAKIYPRDIAELGYDF